MRIDGTDPRLTLAWLDKKEINGRRHNLVGDWGMNCADDAQNEPVMVISRARCDRRRNRDAGEVSVRLFGARTDRR